jgi:membrane-associated protease RseP (regulator of RpoE activity)
MLLDQSKSKNTMMIEAPIEKVWWHFSTTDGWNAFLSDLATSSHNRKDILKGDKVTLIIGELTYEAHCIERNVHNNSSYIAFEDHYKAIFPNGSLWEYKLETSFLLTPYNNMTQVTVTANGYTEDEMMQWVRECGEMGWRQSLFNLKCILELGLDLRNSIFNYPRLGVFNYTATDNQLVEAGLTSSNVKGNYIKKVYPKSPAMYAGMQDGDIITHIDDEPVPTYYDFVRVLSKFYGKNSDVKVQYIRRKTTYIANVCLTYDDQFTGMVNPREKSLEEISEERQNRS